MNNSLAQLRKLHPLTKPALIKACVATALSDGQITDQEYVLLQGISATLDCPLPALHTWVQLKIKNITLQH